MSKRKVLISFIGGFLGAFMIAGGRLFIYEADLKGTLSGVKTKESDIFIFIIMLLICFGLVHCLFSYTEKKITHIQIPTDERENTITYIIRYFLLWGIAMAVIGIYLYAFNPTILYWDSCYQLAQTQHVVPYDNWHPLYTTLWMELILKICNELVAVVLVGAAFWTAVIAGYANWLIKITGRRMLTTIGMIVFLFVPNQALASITILKDVPYVTCVAWMTFIIIRLIFSYKNTVPCFVYVEIILCSMTAWLVRSNGFVLTIGFWIILAFILRGKKTYITIFFSICYILLFNLFLESALEYKDYSKGCAYMALVSDLQVIYYNNGEVEDEIVDMLLQANVQEVWEAYYQRSKQDAVNSYTYVPEALENYGLINFLWDYAKTAINNIPLWSKAVLMRVLPLWDISMEYGAVSIIGITEYPDASTAIYEGKTLGEYGFHNYRERIPNDLTKILQGLVDWTLRMPQKRIFWHTGIFFLILIWQILFLVYKRMHNYLLVFAPIGLHVLSLLLSTGWSNYRYFWPVEVVAVILFPLAVLIGKKEIGKI